MKALKPTTANARQMAEAGWGYLNGFLVNHFRDIPAEAKIPRPMPPLVRTQDQGGRWNSERRIAHSQLMRQRSLARIKGAV